MARINIEDSLWSDDSFLRFLIRVGDEEKAVGTFALAVKLAQRYWCPGKGLVPLEKWNESATRAAMIECRLAEVREGGVYLRGAEDQFGWWFQRQDAGRKGGRPKATVKRTKAADNRSEAAGLDRLPPVPVEAEVLGVRSPVGVFIAAYVKAYQSRYGVDARPDLRGKVQGQIKRFVSETPLERACALIETFCEMGDEWFLTKAHDFGTFIENLSKVGLKLDTGRAPTRTDARNTERTDHQRDQIARIMRGEL